MTMRLLCDALLRYGRLVGLTLLPPANGYLQPGPRHYAAALLLLPLLALFLIYHWIGLLLDEVLFRGYRRVPVDSPVFILGVPRSGTTALHHALARDPQFTTFRTWECLIGVSVTWRVCWRGLGRLDRALGRPLGRLAEKFERRALRGLQAIHPTGLAAPEEDYLALLPVLACFALIVPFPDARWLWRIGRLDRELAPDERRRLMAFYYGCVQRHLYVHGTQRRFLSKNAAFAQAAASLLETFPDARVLCCLREPEGTVSSQVSALDPGLRACHGLYRRAGFRDRMVALLADHYRALLNVLPECAPGRAVFIPSAALRDDLPGIVTAAYASLGLSLEAEFAVRLRRIAAAQRAARPRHSHSLHAFGLSSAMIADHFAEISARFDFAANGPIPAWQIGGLRSASPDLARTG